MEDSVEDVDDFQSEELVYIFLKMNLFRNRVEIFSFFLKYWMPYGNRTESCTSLWQSKCLKQGISLIDIRVSPNLLWRRDFYSGMEAKSMSNERQEWIQEWEYETLDEV